MKGSLTTSAILHVTALAFALVSIGAPEPFDVTDVEALPVDLVPIEELTQIQQGDKTAPLAEKSAPVPTTRPDVVPEAQNIGNNTADIEAPPTPSTKPSNNVSAAAPAKQEKPQPVVDTKANEVKEIVKEETSAPPPQEMASLPTPKPEVTPPPQQQPPAETQAQEPPPQNQEPAEIPVPPNVPRPNARPQPPQSKPEPPKQAETKPAESKPAEKPAETKPDQAKSTEKPSDKKPGEKKQETAKATSSKESDFNADDIAALLNKQEPSGGGAKRSTQQASLGGKKTTGGSTLSQTEMDALRGAIQKNWQIIPGMVDASEVRVQVSIRLDRDGSIIGQPEVTATGGTDGTRRAMAGGALRAVKRSEPFTNLPPDKYDAWSEVVINFDPSDLL